MIWNTASRSFDERSPIHSLNLWDCSRGFFHILRRVRFSELIYRIILLCLYLPTICIIGHLRIVLIFLIRHIGRMKKCLFFPKFEEIHIDNSWYVRPLSGSIRLCPELDGGIETDGRHDFFLSLSLRRRKQSRIGSFRRRHRRKIQCMAIVFGLWGKARKSHRNEAKSYIVFINRHFGNVSHQRNCCQLWTHVCVVRKTRVPPQSSHFPCSIFWTLTFSDSRYWMR